jgi:hypothetical protein
MRILAAILALASLAVGQQRTFPALETNNVWKGTNDFGVVTAEAYYSRGVSVSAIVTPANGGQGLVADGTYFYFGKNNGDGVDGTIYKYTYAGVAVTSFAAPPHAATGDIRVDNGTLLWGSGGSATPVVWEIDPTTGTKIREWNFDGVDYDYGSGVAYKGVGEIWLFTSDVNSNFKIRQVSVNDNGTYSLGTVYSHTALAPLPQGLFWKDGYFWYLAGWTEANLYQLTLNEDGTITVVNSWTSLSTGEPEGLSWDGANWYYGDANRVIRKISFAPIKLGGSMSSTNGRFGVQTDTPRGVLHLKGNDLKIASDTTTNDVVPTQLLEAEDAVLMVASSHNGNNGSSVQLGEVNSTTGAFVNKWSLYRRTVTGGNALRFSFGSNVNSTLNPTGLTLDPTSLFVDIGNVLGGAIRGTRYDNAQNNAPGMISQRARGTEASPAEIVNSDALWGVYARGYAGTGGGFGANNTAAFRFLANENHTDTNHRGTRADMALTPNGANTRQIVQTWYGSGDSDVLGRLDATGVKLKTQVAPTCDSAHRGMLNYTAGGAGVKDSVEVCAKAADDSYAWRVVY